MTDKRVTVRWQYAYTTLGYSAVEDTLNFWGAAGWQLFHVQYDHNGIHCILMRRNPEEEKDSHR